MAALEGEFPPRVPGALHVTVNLRSRRELEARGYAGAYAVHNYFDLDAPLGDRDANADRVRFRRRRSRRVPTGAGDRTEERAGRRALRERVSRSSTGASVRYWLSGPAEDGYGPTLEKVLDRCEVPVTLGRAATVADAYAASDVIVFPSTWEGFGNPTIESIAVRRPCAAFPYPVLAEILSSGVRLFSTEAPENVVKFLAEPRRRARPLLRRQPAPRPVVVLARRPPAGRWTRCSRRTGGSHGERRSRSAPGGRRSRDGSRSGSASATRRSLVAIVAFFLGLVLDFPTWTVDAIVGGLVIACVVLPLPIVFGYGVRAAEREDRGR